ncbi:Crossveinless c [Strongyloides ratti]|uniref:Crossveinless c n=1 Tax=Strongyloides ratti TaxID=34506 RepID=A0A090LB92_STRRB|nr:Crossveinless c [Strongyloides ratti]CEF65393.1 Crossveinless c [Strongyloides ratti]
MNEKKFHFYGKTNQQQNIKIVPFQCILKNSPSIEEYTKKEKNNIKDDDDDDVIYDDVPSTSSLSINPSKNFVKPSNEDSDFSSSFNERTIEKFMSSMLVNAKELCSIDQYQKSEKESKNICNLRHYKEIEMGNKFSKELDKKFFERKMDNNEIIEEKNILQNKKLNLGSPLSNSDSHIIYQSTYNINNTKKILITNSSRESPTLSSTSSIISSPDYHNYNNFKNYKANEPPKEVILKRNINHHIDDINKKGVSSNISIPNNCNIVKIDGYSNQNLYNNNIILEKKNNNKKEKKEKDNHYIKEGEYSQSSSILLQSSSLSSDHHQSTINKNNNSVDKLMMKDKEKDKNFSGGLVKSSTLISVNPLRSLVVNDDGYYSHSPDLSKKYSNNRKNSSITLKNSLTYHHSFFSPLKNSKSGYSSQLIDNQKSWLPNITKISTSIISDSSDDGKLYGTPLDNDIHLNRSLLYQTVSNIDFLVDTSSACLFGLLDKHSTSRLLNTKKVAAFSYNIRRFFSSNKQSSKNGEITFYRTSKIPSCFGMSLGDVQGYCEGETLPKCIFEIMKFILDNASTTDGIFRKSGVRSRIERLKSQCITKFPNEKVFYKDTGECLLSVSQVHDVADTLKQYFREIPGKLFSEKFSDFFITIANGLPNDKQIEALRYVLILMEDTNRYAALTLFSFLNKISSWASENNMSAENLAVCFTPSLFNLNTESDKTTNSMSNLRLKRRKTIAMPSEQELMEYQGAQKSLALMIKHYDQLFNLPTDLWKQLMIRTTFYVNNCYTQPTININNITERDIKECQNQIRELVNEIINDYGLDWSTWIQDCCYKDITIYHKPIGKCKFQLIRASFTIGVSPHEMWKVLNKNRQAWEKNIDYTSSLVVITNDSDIQLISYKNYDERQENSKKCLLFRTWKKDSPELRGGVVLAERSIYDKEFSQSNRHNIFPDVTFSCFLIMPLGNGSSKVNYIHRADVKGRSEVYYSKVYPKIITQQMINLKNFFNTNLLSKNFSNGPLKGKESSF